jgi:hypothetical protein
MVADNGSIVRLEIPSRTFLSKTEGRVRLPIGGADAAKADLVLSKL